LTLIGPRRDGRVARHRLGGGGGAGYFLPVVAGPAEATALGNVLVQARALGAAPSSLDGMRALLRSSGGLALRSYPPAGEVRSWEAAASRAGLG
jgi:rhamnulokinase